MLLQRTPDAVNRVTLPPAISAGWEFNNEGGRTVSTTIRTIRTEYKFCLPQAEHEFGFFGLGYESEKGGDHGGFTEMWYKSHTRSCLKKGQMHR